MTDREQAEEIKMKVCRILSDYHRREDYLLEKAYGDMQQVMESYASIKLAEATKGMYPKEFVKWCIYDEELFYGNLSEELITNNYGGFKSLDELFEYWKQNIRK